MLVYKVFVIAEWQALRDAGQSAGAQIDLADGFVHFSALDQLAETLSKHFKGHHNLMLLAVETDRLGDALRWEPSRGGALFPHLYRELRLSDVVWAQPIEMTDGVHILPPGLS